MGDDLFIEKKWADIKEVKGLDKPNENVIRVYKTTSDSFNFQIRTHGSITGRIKDKQRDMIANVTMTIEDMETILDYMENYQI